MSQLTASVQSAPEPAIQGRRCALPGCDRPVPHHRRRYCTAEHALRGARSAAAQRAREFANAGLRAVHPKTPRTCLTCGRTFPSEGNWNRICTDCRARDDRQHRLPIARGLTDPAHLQPEAEIDSP